MEAATVRDLEFARVAEFIRTNAPTLRAILNAENNAPLSAHISHASGVPQESPSALCCIDEDDLDNWWDEQDVEVKADAFLRITLNQTTSFIYCGNRFSEPRIPVVGSIGETPGDCRTAGDGVYTVAQADGAGEAGR